jgi:hypothetical protein
MLIMSLVMLGGLGLLLGSLVCLVVCSGINDHTPCSRAHALASVLQGCARLIIEGSPGERKGAG